MVEQQGPFWSIYQDLKSGKISRRQFIAKASALGIGLPVVLFVINAMKVDSAFAQATPAAGTAGRPSVGTDGQTRGSGGELKILQWQAPTHLASHASTGTKDYLAASMVTEPLMNFLPDGTLIPTLVKEVPSVENGLLSADLSTVTYNLQEGILWSDGQPLTSADVAFTWQWIVDPANQSTDQVLYGVIDHIDTPDDLTAKITFKQPSLNWYIPFSGSAYGAVYPQHVLSGGADAFNTFRTNPVGTGPYVIDSFKENDQAIYKINDNYREPTKPYFATVNLKGGGDATSAAQAVLQTGDWEYAWNLQVEASILSKMQTEGGKGTVVVVPGTSVERVELNFSDPNKEVNGERSEMNTPHPFFTDKAVRQALSLATDRDTIASQFYQGPPGEPGANNILTGIPVVESPNTSYEFDLDKAKSTLDAAGWVLDGDTRKKDGVELKVTYSTTINPVRQKTQAVNKQSWEAAGFKVQLKQVDAGIFFDSSAGNDQNISHFYSDLQMYTNNPSYTFALNYMQSWYAGKDGSNISQKANGWSGINYARYNNPDFDTLYDQASVEVDAEKAAQLFIQMNDIVINDYVLVPLVHRSADVYAISNGLVNDNVAVSFFEVDYWNIANWIRTPGQLSAGTR